MTTVISNGENYVEDKDLVPAIIYVPKTTVKLNIIATIMNDDLSMCKAENVMGLDILRDAFIDGNEWEAINVKYVLNIDYKE